MCSEQISKLRLGSLPCFEVCENLSNIPGLNDIDFDQCLPPLTNFKYYSVHDFHFSNDVRDLFHSQQSLSTLHWNIRSLSSNIDHLRQLLFELNHSFSLIGISEAKLISKRESIININIDGYNFISQPSLSNDGGVGLYMYVKQNMSYTKLENLTTSTSDFEGLWIELHNNKQRNVVCEVIYRHPYGNIEDFLIIYKMQLNLSIIVTNVALF